MGSYKITTAPTLLPVSLDEAKAHLRVVGSFDDVVINALISAATTAAENFIKRPIMEQGMQMNLDASELSDDIIYISQTPIISIANVKYRNNIDGTLTELSASNYDEDINSNPARIKITTMPTYGEYLNAFQVNFTCGYETAESVPTPIKQAIMLIIGHLFEHREDVVVGASVAELPMGSQHLLLPYQSPHYYPAA